MYVSVLEAIRVSSVDVGLTGLFCSSLIAALIYTNAFNLTECNLYHNSEAAAQFNVNTKPMIR
jgi:hypothetical protein